MSSIPMPTLERSNAGDKAAIDAVLFAAKVYLDHHMGPLSQKERTGLLLSITYIEQGMKS